MHSPRACIYPGACLSECVFALAYTYIHTVPGDLVLLAAGSAVPADSYVNEGLIEVDQSAMTGESLVREFIANLKNTPLLRVSWVTGLFRRGYRPPP